MAGSDVHPTTVCHVNPRLSGLIARRRFMVLLAASAAAMTTLSACGGAEQSTPGGYNFPGARKDETGNYKMRNI